MVLDNEPRASLRDLYLATMARAVSSLGNEVAVIALLHDGGGDGWTVAVPLVAGTVPLVVLTPVWGARLRRATFGRPPAGRIERGWFGGQGTDADGARARTGATQSPGNGYRAAGRQPAGRNPRRAGHGRSADRRPAGPRCRCCSMRGRSPCSPRPELWYGLVAGLRRLVAESVPWRGSCSSVPIPSSGPSWYSRPFWCWSAKRLRWPKSSWSATLSLSAQRLSAAFTVGMIAGIVALVVGGIAAGIFVLSGVAVAVAAAAALSLFRRIGG